MFGEPEADERFVFLEDCRHVLEATSLDRWVDASRGDNPRGGERGGNPGGGAAEGGGAAAGGEDGETEGGRLVKLPECPKCRTPIRRNLRYGKCSVLVVCWCLCVHAVLCVCCCCCFGGGGGLRKK